MDWESCAVREESSAGGSPVGEDVWRESCSEGCTREPSGRELVVRESWAQWGCVEGVLCGRVLRSAWRESCEGGDAESSGGPVWGSRGGVVVGEFSPAEIL